MSTWAHVVGCIRVDGIPAMGSRIGAVERILGPMSTFDHPNDASKLPRGSEGGLRYQIIEYHGGLPWLAIPIWGDLRDFDDVGEIRRWWREIMMEFPSGGVEPMMIRDAVLRVCIEGQEPVILTSDDEEKAA